MNYNDELRIALPSKGRLREDMDKLFSKKGIVFKNLTSDRDYIGSIEGIDNALVYFLVLRKLPIGLRKDLFTLD